MRINKTVIRLLGISTVLVCAGAAFAAETAPAKDTKPAVAVKAPKYVQFNPATYKGAMGKFTLPCEGQAMMMVYTVVDGKPDSIIPPFEKDGVYTLPTGKYMLGFCNIMAKGKNGQMWTVTLYGGAEFEVKKDAPTKIGGAESLVAAIKAGNTGSIRIPYSDGSASLLLTSIENGRLGSGLSATAQNGVAVVPCGTYKVSTCNSMIRDKDGKNWMFSVSSAPDKAKTFEVKPGSEVKLESGEPYTATVDARQNGELVTMNLKMVNANGESCTVRSMEQNAETPGFQVLSKSGEVLMSGKFQYG